MHALSRPKERIGQRMADHDAVANFNCEHR
jgi:hypothetical protein